MTARRQPPQAGAQLSLFAPPDPMKATYAELEPLAARLPSELRMGTSSWSFPGWAGLVYGRRTSERELAREGLREYARHPLLRTVGIDRSYYAPVPEADLVHYASQLPAGFSCCAKAPEALTAPVQLGHGRGVAGEANPLFLSAGWFTEQMAEPFVRSFRDHAGPVIFEFPPLPPAHRLAPRAFATRLDAFLAALPATLSYAIELRDRALLTDEYREVLSAHGAAHVYNYWTAMPLPGTQLARVPVDTAPFVIVRLLMRPGTRHDARAKAFAPFDRIVDPDPVMRRDVTGIVLAAVASGRPVYVLVNNKAEGSAPLTIRALAELIAG